jgi:hypothetical protein
MNEIITERPLTQSNYGWTIFANDIPERLETHTHDSLRRPLASPVTFTIPARREWFGQHRRSGKILGPFRSQEEAQAAVDADCAAETTEWTARLHVEEFLRFVAGEIFASCVLGVICAFIPAMLLAGVLQGDLPNWNPYPAYAVVCVFIFGFFVMSWCSENGPPRPGRGVLKRGVRKRIGIVVLSFFVIGLLVMVGVEWIDTGAISLCKPSYHMTADGDCR